MSGQFAQYPSLADKAVFVTGGGSGIGASVVEHFCAQRARVAFVDIDEPASTALCARIRDAGMLAPTFIACDLRDIAALQAIVKRVGDDSGSITVLVNNAANDDRHKATDVTLDYWNDRIAVNLRHQFFAAQAVYPQMKAAGGGSIVNFGSISWMNSEGNYNAYTTSKAAVHGMTRGLARDWGVDHIRVNTVVPGWVMTQRQMDCGSARTASDNCSRTSVSRRSSIHPISREWCFGSPRTTAGCARRRISSSTQAGRD